MNPGKQTTFSSPSDWTVWKIGLSSQPRAPRQAQVALLDRLRQCVANGEKAPQQRGQVLARLQSAQRQHIARRESVLGCHGAERRLIRHGLEPRLTSVERHRHTVLAEAKMLHHLALNGMRGRDDQIGLPAEPWASAILTTMRCLGVKV